MVENLNSNPIRSLNLNLTGSNPTISTFAKNFPEQSNTATDASFGAKFWSSSPNPINVFQRNYEKRKL